MKKAKRHTTIIFIIILVIFLLNMCVYQFALSDYFSSEYLSEEEIINTVTQNIELLNKASKEIKNIDNSAFYIDVANKVQIDYISIQTALIFNRVSVNLIDNSLEKKNFSKAIKSKTLFEVLKIQGINAIERYYSDSGRICILFDCGSSGIDYYFGFYYSEDNLPIGWKGKDVSFHQYKNRWIYTQAEDSDITDSSYNDLFSDDGVNIYITERITDNWFYFEFRE